MRAGSWPCSARAEGEGTLLLFAYDGSLNGDWVAHYAVRFAAASASKRLRLVHVHEGDPVVAPRLARIEGECRVAGVSLEVELVPRQGQSVAELILARAPSAKSGMIIAGTRQRPRNLAYLARTVSAELLARASCGVVALRVVHPGTLGHPERVLLPLSGHPRGAAGAIPLLDHLDPGLVHLHVLFVREVSRLRYRALDARSAERLLGEGRRFVHAVESELRAGLQARRFALDSSVVVSDDVPKEILVHASKHRARLICLGASERSLPHRLVYGNPIEQVLRDAPCDVAVYRSGR
ncbi:MAG: universal stress protein [Polyangiaceae bacterium]|nr:universal stress protein [Polyangiaceae bacterium]MCE7888310.1 hypothetical protein [Sorangiineae bacterium PRO1]MCL4753545.1 universal stress protein [Myxococcales bacterium]